MNFKYRCHVRNKETLKLLRKSIANARKHGLKILNYSFQHNHVHLILQAPNNAVLTRGMRSLTITFAKGLKKGRVQIERYHLHVLKSIRETRNAIQYVIYNEQKHESGTYSQVNAYSSLLYMKDWQFLLRSFAKKKRLTIKVEATNHWKAEESSEYLYSRALKSLYQDQISFT